MAAETFHLPDKFANLSGVRIRVLAGRVMDDPVIPLGAPGEWDERRVQFCTVIRDEQESRFRMWYLGIGNEPEFEYRDGPDSFVDLYGNHRVSSIKRGYAESPDGINWTKPVLRLASYKGSVENNIIPMPPSFPGRPLVIEDPDESGRYKAVLSHCGGANLAVSPDGVHWSACANGENVYKCGKERGDPSGFDYYTHEPYAFVKDPSSKEKRYRIYSQASTGGPDWIRRTGLIYSSNFKDWTVYPKPVMGMPDGGTGVSGQVHGLAIMPYRGYYIAFIHFCLPHPKTGWFAPQVNLALSNDGENFRVFDDSPLIPIGPDGSWCGGGLVADSAIQAGSETWCYFSGLPVTGCWAGGVPEADERPVLNIGLAKWDSERLLSAGLKPGFSEGYFALPPIDLPANSAPAVSMNADSRVPSEEIKVALLDSKTRLAVPGFGFKDFQVTASDERHVEGGWGRHLPSGGRVLPCFRLAGQPVRVYSITLQNS